MEGGGNSSRGGTSARGEDIDAGAIWRRPDKQERNGCQPNVDVDVDINVDVDVNLNNRFSNEINGRPPARFLHDSSELKQVDIKDRSKDGEFSIEGKMGGRIGEDAVSDTESHVVEALEKIGQHLDKNRESDIAGGIEVI